MSASLREGALPLLGQELAPYPGRALGSLRDTLAITIAVLLGMTLRVPGIPLALALLYLMQRERPGLTLQVGLQIFLGSVFACFGSLLLVQLTDGTETARFLGLTVGIFVSAFCMITTTIPLFWTIVGFYGFVDLATWDLHKSSSAIVTTSLYNVASLGMVVACAVAVEYVFGTRHPSTSLNHEFNKRLGALRSYFYLLSHVQDTKSAELAAQHQALLKFAQAGDTYLYELYDRLHDAQADKSKTPLGIHYRIGLLLRMLDAAVAFGVRPPLRHDAADRQIYLEICRQCEEAMKGEEISVSQLPLETSHLLKDISDLLVEYGNSLQPKQQPLPIPPASTTISTGRLSFGLSKLFLPGVFESTEAVFYALKLTLAAMLCYMIYNAVAWQGILTCVVTVLFTGLTSTGAMKQKQLYRFSGAAIGGGIAIFTVSVLFPNMDSITSLLLVVAPVAFIAGWVTRSPHIGYVGIQIGFGYFLTALPGFSAATQISPARDRVIGVALGILIMWFIFDQLWPVRTTDALRQSLKRIKTSTAELQTLLASPEKSDTGRDFKRLRSAVALELVNAYQLAFSANFEVGQHRKRELAKTRRLIEEIESSSSDFYSAARHL